MSAQTTMRELLENNEYILAPEIYDCISAKCVEACGFKATILSSSEFANSYGYPDLGLLTLDDFVDVTRRICKYSPLPMIVDAEEGFGRAIHAYIAAERLSQAGAAGILITDLNEIGIKGQLPIKEACQRFKAARKALEGTDCILVARTEMSVEDLGVEYLFSHQYAKQRNSNGVTQTYNTLQQIQEANTNVKIGITSDNLDEAVDSVRCGADWITFGMVLRKPDVESCRKWIDSIHNAR